MARALAILSLVALAGCGGCRGRSAAPADASVAEADASTTAASPSAPLPWKGVVVARSLGWPAVEPERVDDGILIRSGVYVYAPRADGALEPIGAPASYVSLLSDADEIAGYDASMLQSHSLAGSVERPVIFDDGEGTFAWDGESWKRISRQDAPTPRDQRRQWLPLTPDPDAGPSRAALPSGYSWLDHAPARDGRIAWRGYQIEDGEQRYAVALVEPQGNKARLATLPADLADHFCEFVDASDGEVYLECKPPWRPHRSEAPEHRIFHLDHDGLVPAFERTAGNGSRPMGHVHLAVDAEGALWSFSRDQQVFERVTPDGAAQRIELPSARADLTAPTLMLEEMMTTAKGSDDYRTWLTLRVQAAPAAPGRPTMISSIVPDASSVWVVAMDSDGAVLYRFSRGASEPTPILVRSSADQQNEIRNTRGLRRWVGHCATVFIPFPSAAAAADGGVDAFFASRKAAIDAAVTKMERPATGRADVAVVEGTLAGRRVAGVLFVRAYPEVSEAEMEAAATRVAEIVTTDPVSPPETSCSVPVLDRIVHQYESRHGTAVYQ